MEYATCEKIFDNIIYLKYAAFEPTDAQFAAYLDMMSGVYKQNSRFVIILDGSEAKYLSAKLRIEQGKWIKDNKEIIQKQCVAQIYVITNVMVKMLLQGIFVIQKPPVQYYVLGSTKEAIDKAKRLV